MIARRACLRALAGSFFTVQFAAEAQQPGKVYRVGILTGGDGGSVRSFVSTFKEELRERGYAEAGNLSIELRTADGRAERVPYLAAELVKLNVDVLVTTIDRWAVSVRQATPNIPVVMTNAEDPVGAGLIKSLAHPGGNITGVTIVTGPEIYGKNLELLKDILPKGARVAILFNPVSPINATYLKTTQEAARMLQVTLVLAGVRSVDDFEPAFRLMKRERAAGFVVLGESLTMINRRRVNDLAVQHRLASSWPLREGVDAGGLVSYGANAHDLWRRAAIFVAKILKGAKPADLPMEQPTKFELVISLKTAKTLGLTIPQSLLLRADEVIQ